MQNNNKDYYPGEWNIEEAPKLPEQEKTGRSKRRFSAGAWIYVICIVTVFAVLATFVCTTIYHQDYYNKIIADQENEIANLKIALDQKGDGGVGTDGEKWENLQVLEDLFEQYSYYEQTKTDEEFLNALMKAYVEATGDKYAEYYTAEEYAQIFNDRVGVSVGIGISIVQSEIEVNGVSYLVFQIASIYKNGPANNSDLKIGDCIYRIKVDGTYQTINELGFTKATNAVRGEEGTTVEFSVLRKNENGYASHDFSIVRGSFEKESVSYKISQTDPTVGIVQITEFNLTTPNQFKMAVNTLLSQNVKHFVFDVRNNPGGDLKSIQAVLTYFLQPGDLILSAIQRDGTVEASYVAEVLNMSGEYAACNVAPNEIGMYAGLDMVVLCNENTASAAEVFTATLRDYQLAPIIGSKTFGKGIMQTTITLTQMGIPVAYVKLTTHAYVTKCGVSYHDIGIEPHTAVELSEEAKQYSFYLLPEDVDNQLQTAISAVKS